MLKALHVAPAIEAHIVDQRANGEVRLPLRSLGKCFLCFLLLSPDLIIFAMSIRRITHALGLVPRNCPAHPEFRGETQWLARGITSRPRCSHESREGYWGN